MDDADRKARKIIAKGGQNLLCYDAGDAEVKYSSRRELAGQIVAALHEAEQWGMMRAAKILRARAKRYRENELYPSYCLNGMAQEADDAADAIERAAKN